RFHDSRAALWTACAGDSFIALARGIGGVIVSEQVIRGERVNGLGDTAMNAGIPRRGNGLRARGVCAGGLPDGGAATCHLQNSPRAQEPIPSTWSSVLRRAMTGPSSAPVTTISPFWSAAAGR